MNLNNVKNEVMEQIETGMKLNDIECVLDAYLDMNELNLLSSIRTELLIELTFGN